MTLTRTVRLLTMLLVVVACVPIYFSEEFHDAVWAVVVVGLLVGWAVGGKPRARQFNYALTGLLIAGMGFLFFLSVQNGEWLLNSVVFGLVATVARSMQLHNSRQQFQLIGLSFLLMVAAAVTNPDLSFAFYFLVYGVLLTWALTYSHLQQRVEESAGAAGIEWKASRFVSRRFLVGSSLLALALLLSSMVIFLLFPRLGLGFFSARTRRGNSIVGFSDALELGHFGNLKDSSRVVLRLELREGRDKLPPISMLKVRGVSFDTYDGRRWLKKRRKTGALPRGAQGYHLVPRSPRLPTDQYEMVEYDIYLEPLEMESKVLFGVVQPLEVQHLATRFDRFRGTSKDFFQDWAGDLTFSGPSMTSTSYTMRSGLLRVGAERLRRTPMRYPGLIRRTYLRLPPAFDPRVLALAREAAGGADNPYDVTINLESYLQTNYGYTTEGEGQFENPISRFLFARRKGHCEYFATAMVLMLRAMGIPARPVNGFLGASYNEFGDYYTINEGRAHSWVEVYFARYGWMTFDPTPAVESLPRDPGFFLAMELWLDSLKLKWYKWVVEYDLEKQLAVYATLWNLVAAREDQVRLSPDLSISDMRRELRKVGRKVFGGRTWAVLLTVVGLLLVVRLFFWWYGRRRPRRDLLDRLAHRLRAGLRHKGFRVLPGTTLPGLVRQAERTGFAAAAPLARLVFRLEEARWGPSAEVDMEVLRGLLKEVSRAPSAQRRT